MRKDAWKKRQCSLTEQLCNATRGHKWAQVHRLGRALSGKSIGPKRRRYKVPIDVRLSSDELSKMMSLPATKGGMSARSIGKNFEEWKEVNSTDIRALPDLNGEHMKNAAIDLWNLKKICGALRSGKLRRFGHSHAKFGFFSFIQIDGANLRNQGLE